MVSMSSKLILILGITAIAAGCAIGAPGDVRADEVPLGNLASQSRTAVPSDGVSEPQAAEPVTTDAPKVTIVAPTTTTAAPVETPVEPRQQRKISRTVEKKVAQADRGTEESYVVNGPEPTAQQTSAVVVPQPKNDRVDKVALLAGMSEKDSKPAKREPGTLGMIMGTILKLGLVLVLAYVTILVLKWLSDRGAISPRQQRDLKLVESIKLPSSGSVHLVRIGDKSLLLGCSAGQVNLLTEIEHESADGQGETSADSQVEAPKGNFTQYLEKYQANLPDSNPAKRLSGLLKDCAAYLKTRVPGETNEA